MDSESRKRDGAKTVVIFLAVAESESFTRGAEQAHVSQLSLSVQITAMEDELQRHAERVVRELEQAAQTIHELTDAEQGRLLSGPCPPLTAI